MTEANKIKIISQYYDQFIEPGTNSELVRRVNLLVTLSSVGGFVMIIFGVLAILQQHFILALFDFIGVIGLATNLYLLKRARNYEPAIITGLFITSLLFIALYLNGGVQNTTFVWYFVYPGIAAFLFGSRRGAIANIIMVIPIFFTIGWGHKIDFIADYSLSFEARFLGAYVVVSYFAFLFEKTGEANRREILAVNSSLELTVDERTKELSSKNELLAQEVKERTAAELTISSALKEKEVLLQEVHHRTKNNLAVIMSLMNLQQHAHEGESIEDVLGTLRNRIGSMFIVHDYLYQSDNLASINLGEYISKLLRGLQESFGRKNDDVELDIRTNTLELSIEQAIPVGLVLNEIITNSFKYAVKPDEQLVQKIELQLIDSQKVSIDISDNGVGIPAAFDPKKSKSLGVKIIYMLIEDQLGGLVNVESSSGTHYHLEFPYETPEDYKPKLI